MIPYYRTSTIADVGKDSISGPKYGPIQAYNDPKC